MSTDAAEMAALSGSPTNRAARPAKRPGQRPAAQRCRPNCGCLTVTVAFTLLGTAALSASIFTDYWERIDYNATSIDLIASRHNGTHRLTWLFNKTVARIALVPGGAPSATPATLVHAGGTERITAGSSPASRTARRRETSGASSERPGAIDPPRDATPAKLRTDSGGPTSPAATLLNKSAPELRLASQRRRRRHVQKRSRRPTSPFYLVPLHGGIWHLCVDLQSQELRVLQEMGLNRDACTEYLANNGASSGEGDAFISRLSPHYLHHHVQSKMHNLSISCAVVCVILLASAALLGTFGILKRQISAILITGVMYILAALFAVFSLVIMHCKRNARRESGIVDDALVSPSEYNEARIFTNSWSMLLGWVGSGIIFVASLFWLFLAKVMRYNQLTMF